MSDTCVFIGVPLKKHPCQAQYPLQTIFLFTFDLWNAMSHETLSFL